MKKKRDENNNPSKHIGCKLDFCQIVLGPNFQIYIYIYVIIKELKILMGSWTPLVKELV